MISLSLGWFWPLDSVTSPPDGARTPKTIVCDRHHHGKGNAAEMAITGAVLYKDWSRALVGHCVALQQTCGSLLLALIMVLISGATQSAPRE